ncbi:MAG: hypothetical protein QMB72_00740 [Brachymonas denitrificans]|nr:hypothetical protein [Brachymonas denitrificans]
MSVTGRILLWLLALLVLAVVFLLYARPDFMVDVSNLVWSCFGPAPGQ